MIRVAPARPEELPLVVEILDQAARWLAARGILQWESPPPAGLRQMLAEEINAGRVYLCRRDPDPRPVATFRLAWRDPARWGDLPGEAGYLYSLALRSDAHGLGLGDTLLSWIKQYFLSHGRPRLRLDCMAANPRLRAYYERRGFAFCGEITDEGYTLARYELWIDDPSPGPSP